MKPYENVPHRGIPTKAPENTLEAFQRAIKLGADAIEFDVRLTSDRIPEMSLKTIFELKIPRICTDNFQKALNFRQTISKCLYIKNETD